MTLTQLHEIITLALSVDPTRGRCKVEIQERSTGCYRQVHDLSIVTEYAKVGFVTQANVFIRLD